MAAPPATPPASSTGLDPKLAILLTYLGWWITGLVFLAVESEHRDVRFHAAQSLVLFGALSAVMLLLPLASVVLLLVSPGITEALTRANGVVWIVAALLWVVLVIKALRGETWRVPLAAPLADRLTARS